MDVPILPRHVFSVDKDGKPISFDFTSAQYAKGFNEHWANSQMCGTGPLLFREYSEADGSSHRVLTGDYETWVGEWVPSALPPGQKLQQPAPLFKKLDDSVVAEELARLGAAV